MRLRVLAIAVPSLIFTTGAFAESDSAGSGPNPFSDCGIGAALFKNNAAATLSNVIWDLGTTALTSATASPETCSGKKTEAAAFIFESYDSLVVESAHGEGEHFTTLMNILEVKLTDRDRVMTSVRSDMSKDNSASISSEKVKKAESFYNSVMVAISNLS